jgi:hypothetical protein
MRIRTAAPSLLLVAACATLCAAPSDAQVVLRIRVTDAISATPIHGALVVVHQSRDTTRALTDSAGNAQLAPRLPGAYTLVVMAPGYADSKALSLELFADRPIVQAVQLQPEPYRAEPVTVTSRRNADLEHNGFYQRKEDNRGFFMDRDEIERRNTRRLSDLLRVVPGIRMVTGTGSSMAVWFQGNEGFNPRGSGMSLCGPRVILDGVEMDVGARSSPTSVDNIILPYDLAGIEVYRRPSQLPARFGGANSACGVIVLWTRRRS